MTEVYDLASALTSLGVGEAVVTVLSPDGVPTPVAWTRLYPPESRMAPADPATVQAVAASAIHGRYGQVVDPKGAPRRAPPVSSRPRRRPRSRSRPPTPPDPSPPAGPPAPRTASTATTSSRSARWPSAS